MAGFDWMQMVNGLQNISGKNREQNWDDSSSFATDPVTSLYKGGYFKSMFGWESPSQQKAREDEEYKRQMDERAMNLKEGELNLSKKRLAEETGQESRSKNLSALDMLAGQRSAGLQNQRRSGLTGIFMNDLINASRG